MKSKITSEDMFQQHVMSLIRGVRGHVWDHRYSAIPDVPDLSAALDATDYWLELKYGMFRLGHDKYDKLKFETTRGQIEWLIQRARHGKSICGILAYLRTWGDSRDLTTDYFMFLTGQEYLDFVWQKEVDVGSAVLRDWCCTAHSVLSGRDLSDFILGRGSQRR